MSSFRAARIVALYCFGGDDGGGGGGADDDVGVSAAASLTECHCDHPCLFLWNPAFPPPSLPTLLWPSSSCP